MQPVIAAVVLTYDAPPGMLEACVASLRGEPDVHVIVVDNGHRTSSLPVVVLPGDVLAGVEILVQSHNRGYAGGMNAGIQRGLELGATAVMLLNDDVVVEPGWLAPLQRALVGERVGAVQPMLLADGTGPPLINSLGVQLGRDGAGTDIAMGEPAPDDLQPSDLAIFTGGAVLLSAAFVRDLGGFDERFFLYYEDVDLAMRGAQRGWRYRLAPASRVVHRGSATMASIGTKAAYYRERNRLWVLFRHRPAGDVGRGLWLSVRRLRWNPRRVHLRALLAGLGGAPRLLVARLRRS